jgi:methionyl-tRNA formyltransferase
MRIGVAATAPLGADVLERLAEQHEVAWLLTRPDAPRGRGRRLAAPPAKRIAVQLGIPVHQPEKPELPAEVDRVVVCAYGLYIPPRLLAQSLWLNVHPSLLPRWRGAAPVERSILAGDEQTGVTIHETVAELDAGPVAGEEAFDVGDLDAGQVYARAAEVAGRLLAEVIEAPRFRPQAEDGVTYAEKITPADRELHLDDPLDSWRRVRALSPHIGARGELHGRRVTIWKARLEDAPFEGSAYEGSAFEGGAYEGGAFEGSASGGSAFVPEVVQPEGRNRMSYDEFLRGLR